MSTNVTSYTAADFFSRQTLELTFRLLQDTYPLLATEIKSTLDHTKIVPYQDLHSVYTGEMLLNSEVIGELKAHTIGKIVRALTEIVLNALLQQHISQNHMSVLRNLIDEWVKLTEWLLHHTSADKNEGAGYH